MSKGCNAGGQGQRVRGWAVLWQGRGSNAQKSLSQPISHHPNVRVPDGRPEEKEKKQKKKKK